MIELQELSAYSSVSVLPLSDVEEDDCYDRKRSKVELESIVTLVYSYFEDLIFVSLLKFSNICADGAWDDFV